MENENEELLIDEEFDEPDDEERMKLVSLRVLRWRFIKFKLERLLDVNKIITQEAKFKLVNTLFACFLQAMEYHENAQPGVGAGAMHSNTMQVVPENMLTELD